jgi:hypothetical protein
MKKGFLLIVLLLVVGCEQGGTQTTQTAGRPILKDVSFSGGDGSSIEKAVVIKAPASVAGIRAEYDWIRTNHPDLQLVRQSVLKTDDKIYDRMDFQTLDGRRVILYFDITDFHGKM